jgi:hypothetical protein
MVGLVPAIHGFDIVADQGRGPRHEVYVWAGQELDPNAGHDEIPETAALASRRYTCIAVFAYALPVLLSAAAIADDYPRRPVTIVVPFTPGGSTDFLGRYDTEVPQRVLHGSFVVENRAGAETAPGFRRRSIRATLVENGEDDAS